MKNTTHLQKLLFGLLLGLAMPASSMAESSPFGASMTLSPQASKTTTTDTSSGLNKTQQEQLNGLLRDIDKKIQLAFKGQEKQLEHMQAELKKMQSLKTALDRKNAALNYQRRYNNFYGGILKKSGVDLGEVAKKLNSIMPGYNFKAQRNYSLSAKMRQINPGSTLIPRGNDKRPAETIQLTNFQPQTDRSCTLAGSGTARTTANSVLTEAFAVVAGGCRQHASLTHNLDFKNAKSASVTSKQKLYSSSFAVGVVGTALATGSAHGAIADIIIGETSASAVALLAWVSFEEEALDTGSVSINIPLNTPSPALAYHANSLAYGVLSPTSSSKGEITAINASLTLNYE